MRNVVQFPQTRIRNLQRETRNNARTAELYDSNRAMGRYLYKKQNEIKDL